MSYRRVPPTPGSTLLLLVFLVTQILRPVPLKAMTITEEREIGEKLLYTVRSNFNLLDDPDISQYLNSLGREIIAEAGPQYFIYNFFVADNKEFNAFAAPSGLIFMNSGLIERTNNENELISVLAHEIAHATKRHIAARLEKEKKISVISIGAALAGLALGNPALSQGIFTGSLAAGQSMSLSYSRQDEEEADRLAFDWMRSMRRDPQDMASMLKTMRRITRYKADQIPQYLLTHPNTDMRLGYVESLIALSDKTTNSDYYKKINNRAFLRIKYRVMTATDDEGKSRNFFTNLAIADKDPDATTMAHYGLALLDAKELNHRAALKNLEKVMTRYPDWTMPRVDSAAIVLDSGDARQATRELRTIMREDPENMYAAFHLAKALHKIGENDEAKSLYQEISGVLPEYSTAYYELARLETEQGHRGNASFYLGQYYLREGKTKLAEQNLQLAEKDAGTSEDLRKKAKNTLKQIKKLKD